MNLRRILAGTAVPATALSAALLGAGPALAVDLTFWHSGNGKAGEVIDELASRFEAAHPDVSIETVYVGNYDDMVTRLQAAVISGDVPDLVQLEMTRYGLFADPGALEPLDGYLEANPEIVADVRPFALEASLYKGASYVLPFNVSTPLMYYNRDLFAAAGLDPDTPPVTWDQLLAAAKALTVTEGGETTQWGINAPPQWVRWAMTNQNGGGWMDPATNETQIDLPASADAYQWAADLVNVHTVASVDGAIEEAIAKQYFSSGVAAITFDSTGSLGGLLDEAPFALGAAPLPCNVVCAAPIGGAGLGIMAGADEENKAAAWDFLTFVMTTDSNALMFTETGYLPILVSTAQHPDAVAKLAEYPAYGVAIDQLDVAFARARPPSMPEIRAIEPSYWEQIVLQESSAKDALGELAQQMRALTEQATN
jgi:sn-glycerol 3-phosphate transport system substrate-binding protein